MQKEIIIYTSLLSYLIVGVFIKDKIKTFKDYAIGSKPFTKLALSATVVATLFGGGSTIGITSMVYDSGLIYILVMMCVPISYLITPIYIIPKLEKFYGCITLPEIMDNIYGSATRAYLGFISYIWLLAVLATQVKALSVLFSNILGYDCTLGAIISFLVIIIYASMRGVYGVIKTDILQFFIFTLILPIIVFLLLKENGGSMGDLVATVPKEDYIKNISIPSIIALAISRILPNSDPVFMHRMLIGRDNEKNILAIKSIALITVLSIFMVIIVTSIAFVKYPNIEGRDVLFIVIKNFLNNEIYYAIFGTALIAVIVSTADSILNTASVIFVNDILKDDKKKNLLVAQLISIITGIIALIAALIATSVLEIILFFGQLYSSSVFIPFLFGLYFKRKNLLMFWSSSLSGGSSYLVLYQFFGELGYFRFLISIGISALCYVVFSRINYSQLLNKKLCVDILPSSGSSTYIKNLRWYILPISAYIILSNAPNWESGLYYVTIPILITNVGLFLLEIFTEKNFQKKLTSKILTVVFWYCFPFFSIYHFYYPNTIFCLFHFAATIILLAAYYNWKMVIKQLALAYILSFLLIAINEGVEHIIKNISNAVYLLLYICAIPYLLLKPKEDEIKAAMNDMEVKLKEKNKAELENIVDFYNIKFHLFQNYNDVDKRYKEIRNIADYVCKEEQGEEIDMKCIYEDLDTYLSYRLHSVNIKYDLENMIKELDNKIITNVNYRIIYVLLFSIGNFIVTIRPNRVNARCESELNSIIFKFELVGLKFQIEDLEKYSVKNHNNTDYLSIVEIKNIVDKFDKLGFSIEKNIILFKIKVVESKKLYHKEIFH